MTRVALAAALTALAACQFDGGGAVVGDAGETRHRSDATVAADSATPDSATMPAADGAPLGGDATPAPADAGPGTGPTPPCGEVGQACCDAEQACPAWSHCDQGSCETCGGTLQACCDQGDPCKGILTCAVGVCTL